MIFVLKIFVLLQDKKQTKNGQNNNHKPAIRKKRS